MRTYLPMDCPACDRRRMLATIVADDGPNAFVRAIECEKCGTRWPEDNRPRRPSMLYQVSEFLNRLNANAIRLDEDFPEEELQRVLALVDGFLFPDAENPSHHSSR